MSNISLQKLSGQGNQILISSAVCLRVSQDKNANIPEKWLIVPRESHILGGGGLLKLISF